MKYIDMHCDTISELCHATDATLYRNKLCIDVEGMKKAETQVQFFACFVNAKTFAKEMGEEQNETFSRDVWNRAYDEVLQMSERMNQEQSEEIKVIHSYEDLKENTKKI